MNNDNEYIQDDNNGCTLYPIPCTLYPVPYTRYKIQDTRYKIQDTRYKIQDTKYKTLFKLGIGNITNNISYEAINLYNDE